MSARLKKKRRLIFLGVAVLLLGVVAAAGYFLRKRQINERLARGREEGLAAMEAGDYEAALHKIGLYVQRNGDDVEAIYQYAQARERVPMPDSKHIGQAIAQYRRLLVLQPGHVNARRRLLNLYVDYGFTREAIDTAQGLEKDDPDRLRAVAKSNARLRKFDDALAFSQKHNEIAPDDLEMQRLTFEIMLARGQPATEVVERAKALGEKFPGRGRFELLTAIAYRAAGDTASAREYLSKAAAHESENDPAFVRTLVEQLESLELFEESLRVLSRAANQGAAGTRRLYVGRLYQAERYRDVTDGLKDVAHDDAQADAELLALRAMALIKLDRAAEAAPIVAALKDRVGDSAEAWFPVLSTVFAPSPAAPKDTIRVCTESLRRAPSNPYFHNLLADAYSSVGEQDLAAAHWSQAARLAPAWAAPLARIASLYTATSRNGEALLVAQHARNRASNDPAVVETLAHALAGFMLASRNNLDPRLAPELRATLAKLDALKADNDSSPLLRVLLALAEGKRDDAIAACRAALDPARVLPDTRYLGLAAVSKAFKLDLEAECLARCEKAHGRVTPVLAAYRARALLAAGKAAEGKEVLRAARADARGEAEVKGWRAAWAAYLDSTSDPEAKAAWTALVQDSADDAPIQSMALRAASLRDDRPTLDRTIDRLRDLTGPNAIAWRVARARWIAAGATGKDRSAELARAASLLGDLTREMPDLAEPRILLARCMVQLDNPREAIEQLKRVVASSPRHHAARLELAGLLQAQADYAGAKTHLDAVADDASAPPDDRVSAATLLARGGDRDKALAILEQLFTAPAAGSAAAGSAAAGSDGPAADPGRPAPLLMLAELYRQRGDDAKAEDACRKYLAKTPDPDAAALLADILAAGGRLKEAEEVLATLDAANVPAPRKELARGRYFAARGDRARAIEQFTAATVAAPHSAAAWRVLVKQHLASGALPQALAAADGAVKASVKDDGLAAFARVAARLPAGVDPAPLLPLIAGVLEAPADEAAVAEVLSAVARAKQNPSDAAGLLASVRDIARRFPRSLAVQILAARTSLASGTRAGAEAALDTANRAMQNFPNAAAPAEVATAALVALGRWDEAALTARHWKGRAPDAPGADIVIATAHLARREANEARAVLERHVSKTPATATAATGAPEAPHVTQATILYARALVLSGKAADAEKLLGARLKDSPRYRAAWLEIAARDVTATEAARWLETAAVLVPKERFDEQLMLGEAWLGLADRSGVAAHKQRAAAAVRDLMPRTESVDVKPSDLVRLGILAEGIDDRGAAEVAYNRALSRNPSEPVALNNLAMILVDSNRAGEAEKFASRAAALEHPRRASFLDTLATAQEKSEQWPRAVESIRKALELEPSNLGFQIHQAVILSDAGDAKAKEAREALEGIRLDDPRLTNSDRKRLNSLLQKAASGN